MSKLCYKVNGSVKKYDLKDNVSGSPKLCVKVGGSAKYLKLAKGNKNGEIQIKVGGKIYYVQTKVYEDITAVDFTYLTSTYRRYSTGGIALWPIYAENKKILACIAAVHFWGYTNSYNSVDLGDPSISSKTGFSFTPGKYNKVAWKIVTPQEGEYTDCYKVGNIKMTLLEKSYTGSSYFCRDNSITDSSTPLSNISSSRYEGINIWNDYSSSPVFRTGWYSIIGFDNKGAASGNQTPRLTGSWIYATEAANSTFCTCYAEFPENGYMGVTPEEVINEWANTLGNTYSFNPS